MQDKQPTKRIPVTILTGFLGAGKTTLLNHLIASNKDKRIAIIENEFGNINIDSDLVISAENGIFELSDGCICCTLNEELITTLENLVNSQKSFDHLIIETTGIAEPDAIAEAFLATPEIQRQFSVDGVICVADAHHVTDILGEREEAKKQLTFADFIVLNKASEVSAEYLTSVKALLKTVNPFADIELADHGQIKTDVLNMEAYASASLESKIKRHTDEIQAKEKGHHHDHECGEGCTHGHHHHEHKCDDKCTHEHHHHHECDDKCTHEHEHDHECGEGCTHEHHHHHKHLTDISSESFILDTPLDAIKFRQWINVVLLIQKQSIYRIKGIISFAWDDGKIVFQSVQEMFAFQRGEPWGDDEKRQTRIVFIGKNLRRDILQKSLEQCYYKGDDYDF